MARAHSREKGDSRELSPSGVMSCDAELVDHRRWQQRPRNAITPMNSETRFGESGHILVVHDQQELSDLVRKYLTDEGFRVSTANNGAGLREEMAGGSVDLVILDLVLPEDGLQLARELRSGSDIGIIMVTGRSETVDGIIGLEMGADDYLAKPFHMRELLARVRSVLRRSAARASERSGAPRSRISFAGWTLDLASRELLSPSGEEVRLTSGEYELLAALVDHPNQVLSRNRLLDLSRHRAAGPFDRTIDVQVGRLRRKLRDDPQNPTMIKTVRSGGYIFAPPVESK
jgi:two-component system OmpR family response regulator